MDIKDFSIESVINFIFIEIRFFIINIIVELTFMDSSNTINFIL
jgi:hypothetical protein